jgi:hypothetical protein
LRLLKTGIVARAPLNQEVKDTHESVEDTTMKSQGKEPEQQIKIVRSDDERSDPLGRKIAGLPLNQMKAGYDYAFGKGGFCQSPSRLSRCGRRGFLKWTQIAASKLPRFKLGELPSALNLAADASIIRSEARRAPQPLQAQPSLAEIKASIEEVRAMLEKVMASLTPPA